MQMRMELELSFTMKDLPIPKEVFEIADITGNDPLEMAIAYGEDFELLLTVPPRSFR